MDKWEAISNFNWVLWFAGFFLLLEAVKWMHGLIEWFCKTFGIKTKRSLEKQEQCNRMTDVEEAIKDIRETANHNVEMFLEHERNVIEQFLVMRNEIITELNKLHDKNRANDEADCAMLRDRITSGMRYFRQFKDADGNVHISFTDYENMDALFQQYFAKHGNGTVRNMYENEFKKFIIDR